jgi:hypothetical protein
LFPYFADVFLECAAMQNMTLLVRIKGATDAELHRAGLAAMAVFEKACVSPLRAAEASFAREGYDLSGFDPDYEGYDEEDAEIAHLWGEAEDAARKTGCAGWPEERTPQGAILEITGYPEDDEEDEDNDLTVEELLAIYNQSAST